jgi:hypothetical protein
MKPIFAALAATLAIAPAAHADTLLRCHIVPQPSQGEAYDMIYSISAAGAFTKPADNDALVQRLKISTDTPAQFEFLEHEGSGLLHIIDRISGKILIPVPNETGTCVPVTAKF